MFIKYPSIKHLPESQMSKNDKRLNEEEVDILAHSSLDISEKLDGARVGIRMHENVPILFKRGSIIKTGEHEQYNHFKSWIFNNIEKILKIPNGYIVYGEWLSVQHTVYYDLLPEFFLAFDVIDDVGKYLPIDKSLEFLNNIGLCVPRRIKINLSDIPTIIPKMKSNYSTTDNIEGVVVRNDFSDYSGSIVKGKFVRQNFVQGKHWSKGQAKYNQLIKD
jgi:hypothetical protein